MTYSLDFDRTDERFLVTGSEGCIGSWVVAMDLRRQRDSGMLTSDDLITPQGAAH